MCFDCQRPSPLACCVDCVRQHQRSIPREQRAPRFTDRQGNAIPLATYIIIGLTVVVYGLQWVGQLIPGFPDVSNLLMYSPLHTSVAAVEFSQVTGQQLFQPWRMLTSALVHSMGSPLHLLLNMAVLWLIGRQIEQFLGAAKFVAIMCCRLWWVGGLILGRTQLGGWSLRGGLWSVRRPVDDRTTPGRRYPASPF